MNKIPLSDQLKIQTAARHQELEKKLIKLLRAMRNKEDYLKILQFFYSYFAALEERINLYIGANELPDHLERRKSESLLKDINSLGGLPGEKVVAADLPVIVNHLQAFGAMYVMEGSTLGGLIISKMIGKQLNINEEGISFFQSYGEQLTAMWDGFKAVLDMQVHNEDDAETVIDAANATFGQFILVLDRS